MTPTELIAAFESLAEAPDGVACLRELILQLAVRGRLVEQRPGDGSASDLVQRVLAEAKGRKIRVEIVHESRNPFDAPTSWRWVHLGDAMDLFNGRAFKPADWRAEGLRIVRIQNLNDPDAAYNHCDPAIDRRFCIDSGCLLLSWSGTPGTSFGAFVWQGGLAALNQHIFRCQPRADAFAIHFLRLAINSRLNEMIARAHGGVGLRHITKGKLEGLWLPVPPLAEQHRIVARVEELMGLLDRLEAARAKRETTRAAARDSVLAALREADSPAEVDAAWTRFAQRMDDLVCDPADIAPLRQAVLQLAVRGLLVQQDPKDEPASMLLERIGVEKARLVKAKRIRAQEPIAPVSMGEVPFRLPDGWEWGRLGQISQRIHYGFTASADPGLTDVRLLRITDIQDNRVDWETVPGCVIDQDEVQKFALKDGDVVVARTGGTIGKTYLVEGLGEVKAVFASYLIRVEPPCCMGSRYLKRALESPLYWQQLTSRAAGTGQPNVSASSLSTLLLPVPPLAEQRRIVARVEELMSLLDQLEQRFDATKATHAAFASAAVHHVVA